MKQNTQNKSFGILFFLVFLALGLWPLTKNSEFNLYLISIAIIFLVLGLINSKLLTPLNKIWIKFGEILGMIVAPIVMSIVYFLILTPISLVVRLFGKDLLSIKFNNQINTYWIKRKKGLGSMDKQF